VRRLAPEIARHDAGRVETRRRSKHLGKARGERNVEAVDFWCDASPLIRRGYDRVLADIGRE
jgi:hypothetical protein